MPKYTTGEIAKICNVSVRTVQYYDTRGILIPSEISDGKRRLYSDEDLKKMKIICFLRDTGISLNNIAQLFANDNSNEVISILIDQQTSLLNQEIAQRNNQLEKLNKMKKMIKNVENFSVESISDIAYLIENKKKMKQLHMFLLISGIPMGIIQWSAIIISIVYKIWWPIIIWLLIAILYGIGITNFYFKKVSYICPHCHNFFKPTLKEAFFAKHTPTLRKLTCPHCNHNGFCIETYQEEENENV